METTMPFGLSLLGILLLVACTQETQNKLSRAVQNWTDTDGVLEVYAGEKLVKRFSKPISCPLPWGLKIAFLAPTGLAMASWMPM